MPNIQKSLYDDSSACTPTKQTPRIYKDGDVVPEAIENPLQRQDLPSDQHRGHILVM